MPRKLFKLLQHPLFHGGRKVPIMSNVLPNPPASSGPDDRLAALIDTVSRLADQQRSLIEVFRANSAPAAAPTTAAAVANPGDLRGLIAGMLKEHQASVSRSAVRQVYSREHLSDLPSAYRRLLPETDDNAALVAAEQDIRRQFREDLKTTLRSANDPTAAIGGDASGGAPPAAAVDYSKLSPLQQIAVGLRSAAPTRVLPVGDAAKPAAAASASAAESPSQTDPDDAELFVGSD